MNLVTITLPVGTVVNITAEQLHELERALRGEAVAETETEIKTETEVKGEPEAETEAETEVKAETETEAETPAPRRRGRPRKDATPDDVEPAKAVETEAPVEVEAVEPTPAPRRRGRPRKNPVVAPAETPAPHNAEFAELRTQARTLSRELVGLPSSTPAKQAAVLRSILDNYGAESLGALDDGHLAAYIEEVKGHLNG